MGSKNRIFESGSEIEVHHCNFLRVSWVIAGLFLALFFPVTAHAQFGGKSGAPSGSVVDTAYDTSGNDKGISESSALEAASFSSGSTSISPEKTFDATDDIKEANYIGQFNRPVSEEKPLFNRRQRYFIKKLRLEFAARETIERDNGIATSWTRVGFYLRDLNDELTIAEQSGEGENAAFINEMARDLNLVEMTLDDHIDEVLLPFGKNFSKKPSYAFMPPLPKSSSGLRAKMKALSEKSELVDFATKALQAMVRSPVN